jgi:hypothetical protein
MKQQQKSFTLSKNKVKYLQLKINNLSKAVKTKIYQLLDGIEDEAVLNQVMDDVAFYAKKKTLLTNCLLAS